MAEILGKEPETYASTLTAVEMARAAYRQAAHLSEFGVPILGVSCTCALATDRVKKGDHKVMPTAGPLTLLICTRQESHKSVWRSRSRALPMLCRSMCRSMMGTEPRPGGYIWQRAQGAGCRRMW